MSKRKRFQTDETTQIFLPGSDEEWIKIKTRLNTGDQKKLEAVGMKPIVVSGQLFQVVDFAIHDIDRAMIFLVDWNLNDDDGKNIDLSRDAVTHLETDTFQEINQAITKHVIAQAELKKQEREERKKEQTPPAVSSETTSS